MDQPALIVPDVLAMHDDVVPNRDRDAFADVHVVVDEKRLLRSVDLHDEALMCPRWAGVIGEQARDCAVRCDLDAGAMIREGTVDRRVPRDDRAARRGENGEKEEDAKRYERGTLSPRCVQCGSKALRKRPAAIRSASAITTTTAMRRKSFVTYPRSHAAARSRAAEGAPTAREVPLRDPYRVVRAVAAGRDGCSRSEVAGRGADARRDASTARRERARTRCFFATERRGYPTPYAPPRMPLDAQTLSTAVVVLAVVVVLLALWVAWLQLSDAVLRRRLRRLIGDGEGLGLDELLDKQFGRLDTVAERVEALNRLHHELEALLQQSIQKVGVIRFNPFADTGGDQSFAVALLDAQGNGIVLSSLHGRADTRIFAKQVQAGRSKHALSDEEQDAIRKALSPAGA